MWINNVERISIKDICIDDDKVEINKNSIYLIDKLKYLKLRDMYECFRSNNQATIKPIMDYKYKMNNT